jgi:hypothetical protein
MSAPALVVVALTVDELRTLVREEVRSALAEHVPSSTTQALVDRRELARLLAMSPATVTRLTSEGAPVIHVGDSPRYDVAAFRAWLDERGRRGTKASAARSDTIAGVRLLSRGRS